MKYKMILLLLPLCVLSCEEEKRSITYNLHPHAGYISYGTATFTEGDNKTDVAVKLYNLMPGVNYVGHIHPGDTATYNSSPITLHLGSFTPTTAEYQLNETWNVTYNEVLNYDGCIAVHNPNIGVAVGNIGSNAE